MRIESTKFCISFEGSGVMRLTTQVTANATGKPNTAEEMLRNMRMLDVAPVLPQAPGPPQLTLLPASR